LGEFGVGHLHGAALVVNDHQLQEQPVETRRRSPRSAGPSSSAVIIPGICMPAELSLVSEVSAPPAFIPPPILAELDIAALVCGPAVVICMAAGTATRRPGRARHRHRRHRPGLGRHHPLHPDTR